MENDKRWDRVVEQSRDDIIDYDDQLQVEVDRSIIWANDQIEAYKEALLAVIRARDNCTLPLSLGEAYQVNALIRNAKGIS